MVLLAARIRVVLRYYLSLIASSLHMYSVLGILMRARQKVIEKKFPQAVQIINSSWTGPVVI